jgi:hypothetical protein
MSILLAVFVVLFPLLILVVESSKLTPIVITSALLSLSLLGYVVLDVLNSSAFAALWAVGMVSFVAGYYLHRFYAEAGAKTEALEAKAASDRQSSPGLTLFVVIITGLAAYHLVMVGIPIFTDNVEVSRFDFTSSGLFGVPGRMYLFGLPFAVLLVSIGAGRKLLPVSRRLLVATWGAYIVANLLGGFKGGMVNVLVTALLVATVAGRPITVKRVLLDRYGLLVLFAIAFGAAISFTYESVGVNSAGDSLLYLGSRTTVIAATPGYEALDQFGTEGSYGSYYWHDARYFISKYLPFLGSSSDDALTLEKSVSSLISGTPSTGDEFLSPVTLGAFPELIVNVGILGAIAIMSCVGAGFSYLLLSAQHTHSALSAAVLAFVLQMTQIYVLNGNLMYAAINCALMSALLVATFVTCTAAAAWFHGVAEQ